MMINKGKEVRRINGGKGNMVQKQILNLNKGVQQIKNNLMTQVNVFGVSKQVNAKPISEQQFMRYYEENIRLKRQLEERNVYVEELKRKLQAQMDLNKTAALKSAYSELRELKQETRKSGPVKGRSGFSQQVQSRKVQSLLQIIQSYKQKLLVAEEQSANLRQQRVLLQQDLGLRNVKVREERYNDRDEQWKGEMEKKNGELVGRLRQKVGELELEKERTKYLQAELRRIQNKHRTLQMQGDMLQQLKVENRILQQRVMKLTLINEKSSQGDYRSLQQKSKQLEMKLKAGIEKYNRVKEEKTKLQIDYKLMQNKLIEVQHQLQTLQRENVELRKNQVSDPVVQRLIKDRVLMARVIGEIEQPKRDYLQGGITRFQSTQRLIQEKQQLARQLIQIKAKVRLMQQSWREKQMLVKIQKQQLKAQLQSLPNTTGLKPTNSNNNKIYTSKQGVQYSGDVAMFSQQVVPTTIGVNYFDVYLGQINLIESLLRTVVSVGVHSTPLIMATVDFYNFPTENTKLVQGLMANLNTEFVFKLQQDEFFFKFIAKSHLKVSIWINDSGKNALVGVVEVPLKQLLINSSKNIAPVVNTSAPIINGQRVVGTVFFDFRIRFPIYEQISSALNQPMTNTLQTVQEVPQRKLIIQIDEGSDFSQSANLFVYYQFRLQDYYTRTSPGPRPQWSHYKMIDLRYDEELKNYLRRNSLELTVFDDTVGLQDEQDSDVVGSGRVDLLGLIEDKPIKEKISIRKNGVVVGTISLKIFWYESREKQSPVKKSQANSRQNLIEALHGDICQYVVSIGSTFERQFKKIDSNATNMVSFDEFLIWVTKVKQTHKYSRQIISLYYDTFQQPLNLLNWTLRFENSQKTQNARTGQTQLIPELNLINQMLKKNSMQIDTQVSLREYLKDKKILDVTLDIDRDGDGMISRQELIKYMRKHNIVVDEEEIQGKRVDLVSFLKKYGK